MLVGAGARSSASREADCLAFERRPDPRTPFSCSTVTDLTEPSPQAEDSDVPDSQLQRFVAEHINSVHTLEVLLTLLRRPDEAVSVDDVQQLLKTGAAAARDSLMRLLSHGFLEKVTETENGFRYHPLTPEMHHLSSSLAQAYATRPTFVIRLIHSPSAV